VAILTAQKRRVEKVGGADHPKEPL